MTQTYTVSRRTYDELFDLAQAAGRTLGDDRSVPLMLDAILVPPPPGEIRYGNLVMNSETRRITVGGETLALSGKQTAMLRYFAENADVMLSRDRLVLAVWGRAYVDIPLLNYVAVLMVDLRKRLATVSPDFHIRTQTGGGYIMEMKDAVKD